VGEREGVLMVKAWGWLKGRGGGGGSVRRAGAAEVGGGEGRKVRGGKATKCNHEKGTLPVGQELQVSSS